MLVFSLTVFGFFVKLSPSFFQLFMTNNEDAEVDDCDDGDEDEGIFFLPPSGVGLWAGFRGGASDWRLTWLRRGWEQEGAEEPPNGQQGEEQGAQYGPDAPCWGVHRGAAAFWLLRGREATSVMRQFECCDRDLKSFFSSSYTQTVAYHKLVIFVSYFTECQHITVEYHLFSLVLTQLYSFVLICSMLLPCCDQSQSLFPIF